MEELEAGPSGLKKLKKMLEKSDIMAELVEVLRGGRRAIMDTLNKQEKLLQELVELEVDKIELMQLDWWVFVKTGFTLEVTLRKSGVEGGWDLTSPYVVRPCLHAQWSRISGLVGGGDKDLSRGVNKPVGVEPSRLSE